MNGTSDSCDGDRRGFGRFSTKAGAAHRNPSSVNTFLAIKAESCSGPTPNATSKPSLIGCTALSTSRISSRSEEHTSELQSLMRNSYAVFCLKKKKHNNAKSSMQTHHNTK